MIDREEASALIRSHFQPMQPYYNDGALDCLLASYSEPQRAYHNEIHIAGMLCCLGQYRDYAVKPYIIEHAILWHDVAYRTQDEQGRYWPDTLNVHDSIAAYSRFASDATLPVDRQSVVRMIAATDGHRIPTEDESPYEGFVADAGLFLDFDLAQFARPWDKFMANTRDIRREYDWVEDDVFNRVRADILDKFAARDTLYHAVPMRDAWTKQARSNLQRSAAELRSIGMSA